VSTGAAAAAADTRGEDVAGDGDLTVQQRRVVAAKLQRERWEEQVNCINCHFSTIMSIVMREFQDRCHNSMHSYVIAVSKSIYHGSNVICLVVFINLLLSKSIYHGSNVIFLDVLSNHVVTAEV